MLHKSQCNPPVEAMDSSLANRALGQCEGSEHDLFDEMSRRDEKPYDHNSIDEQELFDARPMNRQIPESKL